MKPKVLKSLAILLVAVMFFSMIPIGTFTVGAATNPYGKYQTIDGVTTVRCTWYAWQAAYDRCGVALPGWGDAGTWYNSAVNAGLSTGSIPKSNSIAVWNQGGNYGHVAFVTSVSGNTMTVDEGGVTYKGSAYNGDGIKTGTVTNSSVNSAKDNWNPNQILVGFIYLSSSSNSGSSTGPHTHSYGAWQTVTAPTCTTAGSSKRVCSCGDTQTQSIPVLGHNWNAGEIITNAGCTEAGVKQYTCTRCGETKTEALNPTGHSPVTDSAVPATCTASGLTEGLHCSRCHTVLTAQQAVPALGHDYQVHTMTPYGNTVHVTYACTRCGDAYSEDVSSVESIEVINSTIVINEFEYGYFSSWSGNYIYSLDEILAKYPLQLQINYRTGNSKIVALETYTAGNFYNDEYISLRYSDLQPDSENEIGISYMGQQATANIRIIKNPDIDRLTEVTVVSVPQLKDQYPVGSKLELSGVVFEATFYSGKTEQFTVPSALYGSTIELNGFSYQVNFMSFVNDGLSTATLEISGMQIPIATVLGTKRIINWELLSDPLTAYGEGTNLCIHFDDGTDSVTQTIQLEPSTGSPYFLGGCMLLSDGYWITWMARPLEQGNYGFIYDQWTWDDDTDDCYYTGDEINARFKAAIAAKAFGADSSFTSESGTDNVDALITAAVNSKYRTREYSSYDLTVEEMLSLVQNLFDVDSFDYTSSSFYHTLTNSFSQDWEDGWEPLGLFRTFPITLCDQDGDTYLYSYAISETENVYVQVTNGKVTYVNANSPVPDVVLSSVTVVNRPTKTTYEIGESLNTAGLTLKLTYSDGTTETVSDGFTTSGFTSATAGTNTVTVLYGGKTTTFTVEVKDSSVIDEDAPQIVVSSGRAVLGNNINVTVALKNNPGIASAKLKVTYNSEVFTLANITDGGILGTSVHKPQMASPYTLSWVNDTATVNFTANGTLATLTFAVDENAQTGNYPITVSYSYDDYDIYNVDVEPIRFAVVNGNIEVTDVIIGDVNGDGKVNNLDRVVLTRYLADWDDYPESAVDMVAADVNCDGKVNNLDRVILTRYLADWDDYTELPYTG